jgi:hypothetical protein
MDAGIGAGVTGITVEGPPGVPGEPWVQGTPENAQVPDVLPGVWPTLVGSGAAIGWELGWTGADDSPPMADGCGDAGGWLLSADIGAPDACPFPASRGFASGDPELWSLPDG